MGGERETSTHTNHSLLLQNLRSDDEFDMDDFDKDDPDIMEECLQMYNDYKPDPSQIEGPPSSKKKVGFHSFFG